MHAYFVIRTYRVEAQDERAALEASGPLVDSYAQRCDHEHMAPEALECLPLYCSQCGSRHVQISAWIRPNARDQVVASGCDGPSSHEWCEACNERGDDGDTRTTYDRREAAQARLDTRRDSAPAARQGSPGYDHAAGYPD